MQTPEGVLGFSVHILGGQNALVPVCQADLCLLTAGKTEESVPLFLIAVLEHELHGQTRLLLNFQFCTGLYEFS